MNVAVVGGGIVGLSSAYTLARRGASVTVFEKGSVGSGSTERSAGGIRSQFSTPVNVALSRASAEVWETFEERFGEDIAYRRSGYLFLAREDETAERFRENVALQTELGVESRFLAPEEATAHCPELRAERFVGATYCPTDGFADPHLALQGYARAAREAGTDVRTGTPVTGIARDGNRVTGVRTADGRFDADFVVNAAGPWARRVAAMAGVDLPVAPRRRQIAVVAPETPVPEDVPLTIDLDTGSYFRPEREGAALVGGHFSREAREPAGERASVADGDRERRSREQTVSDDSDEDPDAYARSMDFDWAGTAVERAADYAGYFGPETAIVRGWAGLYAVTPDHHPIVEESVPGFVNAVGFSGHGFQHAPATGKLVAELCLDGEASLVDISALRSDRFEAEGGPTERNVA